MCDFTAGFFTPENASGYLTKGGDKMLFFINEYLISPALVAFLTASGCILYAKLKFFPVTKSGLIIRSLLKKEKSDTGVSPYKALAVALAGTLGVGNIAGVALAISAAGAGALFWMWVSALFAMIIKYAETVVAVRNRTLINGRLCGGAMYFMRSKFAAALFAVFCIICSFTVGSAIQTNTVAESALIAFEIPRYVSGIVFALCIFIIIRRGFSGIGSFCSVIIPLLTAGYMCITLYIIIVNRCGLPGVFSQIFREAFGIKQAGAGVSGFLLTRAVKTGFTRGLITNEAGCGTSPIAHSESEISDPVRQGFLGIAEVFIDTIVLCTLTGLTVLTTMSCTPELYGMELVRSAFSRFIGPGSDLILCTAMFLFALSSVVSWSHYGSSALYSIFKDKAPLGIYRILLAVCAFAGCLGRADTVWRFADITCAAMTFINTSGVMFRIGELKRQTALFFDDAVQHGSFR